MKKFTLPQVKNPSEIPAVLRDGARRLLQEAIEYEVLEYVQKFKGLKDEMNAFSYCPCKNSAEIFQRIIGHIFEQRIRLNRRLQQFGTGRGKRKDAGVA